MRRKEKFSDPVTIKEVVDFVKGKKFHSVGTVVNEKDEEIGVSFIFFESGKPEESAMHWSIHCLKNGTLWIVKW